MAKNKKYTGKTSKSAQAAAIALGMALMGAAPAGAAYITRGLTVNIGVSGSDAVSGTYKGWQDYGSSSVLPAYFSAGSSNAGPDQLIRNNATVDNWLNVDIANYNITKNGNELFLKETYTVLGKNSVLNGVNVSGDSLVITMGGANSDYFGSSIKTLTILSDQSKVAGNVSANIGGQLLDTITIMGENAHVSGDLKVDLVDTKGNAGDYIEKFQLLGTNSSVDGVVKLSVYNSVKYDSETGKWPSPIKIEDHIYSGGQAKNGLVSVGSTDVTLGSNSLSYPVSGDTSVNSLFGAGAALGIGAKATVLTDSKVTLENNSNSQYMYGAGYAYNGGTSVVNGNSTVVVTSVKENTQNYNPPVVSYDAFGGAKVVNSDDRTTSTGNVAGTSSLVMKGSTVSRDIYSGSDISASAGAARSSIGGTVMSVENGKIHNDVFGGSKVMATGTGTASSDIGSVDISVTGGTVTGSFYGGSNVSATGNSAKALGSAGSISLTTKSGTIGGSVFGGDRVSGANASSGIDDITLLISKSGSQGAEIAGSIYGGSQALSGGKAAVNRVTLSIEEGTNVDNSIYGGGYADGTNSSSSVTSSTLNISSGSVIFGDVYGGGYAVNGGTANITGGTTEINLNTGSTITGSVYGGGYAGAGSTAKLEGDGATTTINLKGGIVSGDVYGTGNGEGDRGSIANTNLNLYAGSINGFHNFNTVNALSDVTLGEQGYHTTVIKNGTLYLASEEKIKELGDDLNATMVFNVEGGSVKHGAAAPAVVSVDEGGQLKVTKGGSFESASIMAVTGGSVDVVSGSVTVNGGVNVSSGSVNVGSQSAFNVGNADGAKDGTLTVNDGQLLSVSGTGVVKARHLSMDQGSVLVRDGSLNLASGAKVSMTNGSSLDLDTGLAVSALNAFNSAVILSGDLQGSSLIFEGADSALTVKGFVSADIHVQLAGRVSVDEYVKGYLVSFDNAPKASVGQHVEATVLNVVSSDLTVGQGIFAKQGAWIENSTVTVADKALSSDGALVIEGSDVKVLSGDMLAGGRINMASSDVSVSGDLSAGNGLNITNTDADIKGSVTVTSLSPSSTSDGAIAHDSHVSVTGSFTTSHNYAVSNGSSLDVGGSLSSDVGFDVQVGSALKVQGDVYAKDHVMVYNNSSAEMNNLTSDGSLAVQVSSAANVRGSMTAGTNVTVYGSSSADVKGDMTAANGYIYIAKNASATVGGNMTSNGGYIFLNDKASASVSRDMVSNGNSIYVQAGSFATVGGNMTSISGDISLSASSADVDGNMISNGGKISLGGGSSAIVGGGMIATSDIIVSGGSVANVSKDMTSSTGYVFITGNSDANVSGDMKASTGIYVYSGSSLDVDGNMTSDGNIIVKDTSTATVLGGTSATKSVDVYGGSSLNTASADFSGAVLSVYDKGLLNITAGGMDAHDSVASLYSDGAMQFSALENTLKSLDVTNGTLRGGGLTVETLAISNGVLSMDKHVLTVTKSATIANVVETENFGSSLTFLSGARGVIKAISGLDVAVTSGDLTLGGGAGIMRSLALSDGSLTIENAGYGVSGATGFSAAQGTDTIANVASYSPAAAGTAASNSMIYGSGSASATLTGGATLTLTGVNVGRTILLGNFTDISKTGEGNAWGWDGNAGSKTIYDGTDSSLLLELAGGLAPDSFRVSIDVGLEDQAGTANKNLVLNVQYHSVNLVWANSSDASDGASNHDLWTTSGGDRNWYYDETNEVTYFKNGDSVAFNGRGEDNNPVRVSGDMHPDLVTISDDYRFVSATGDRDNDQIHAVTIANEKGSSVFDVNVTTGSLNLTAGALSFDNLTVTDVATVAAGTELTVTNVASGDFGVQGTMTLNGGAGFMDAVSVDGTLTIGNSGYGVTESFEAGSSSNTNVTVGTGIQPEFGGSGSASANLASGAVLNVSGVDAAGDWTILDNFASKGITGDGWNALDTTLKLNDSEGALTTGKLIGKGWDAYTAVESGGTDLVLHVIDRTGPGSEPDENGNTRDLVWASSGDSGTSLWTDMDGKASIGAQDRGWYFNSSDVTTYFKSGDSVTFNNRGQDNPNVAVSDEIHAGTVSMDAASYNFSGNSIVAAEILGNGGDGVWNNVVTAGDLVVGANSNGEASDFAFKNLTIANAAAVKDGGSLAVEKIGGEAVTVDRGTLTLGGASGSVNSLTLNDQSRFNVNSNGYGVSASLNANDGSLTVIGAGTALTGGSFAFDGGSSAVANIASGAALSIDTPLKIGTNTILSGFAEGIAFDGGNGGWGWNGGAGVDSATLDYALDSSITDERYLLNVDLKKQNNDSELVIEVSRKTVDLVWADRTNALGNLWTTDRDRNWFISNDPADTTTHYFTDGADVWFNERGSDNPDVTLSGDVNAGRVLIGGADYHYTGDSLTAKEISAGSTNSVFDNAVTVSDNLFVQDDASLAFADLTLKNLADVEGTVTVADIAGGTVTVGSGGSLTLAGGSGDMETLTLKGALSIDNEGYGVKQGFAAQDGSSTFVSVINEPKFNGSGSASANLATGAVLNVSGVDSTGRWTILDDFARIDGDGWNALDTTLKIENHSTAQLVGKGWDAYTAAEADGANRDFVLYVHDRVNHDDQNPDDPNGPEGPNSPNDPDVPAEGHTKDLVWADRKDSQTSEWTNMDVHSSIDANRDRGWYFNSSDVTTYFRNGDSVTFNGRGAANKTVYLTDEIAANRVYLTSGDYTYVSNGGTERGLTANKLLATGGDGTFNIHVGIEDQLTVTQGSDLIMKDLELAAKEINSHAQAYVGAGSSLTVADIKGGDLNIDGSLKLTGGSGSMNSLSLNGGSSFTLDRNSYSVAGSFNAYSGSNSYFDLSNWASGSYMLGGQGSASATLEGGAVLTISGITSGATGSWTLLDNFSSITANGWNSLGSTLNLTGYDATDRNVYVSVENQGGGKDLVLHITANGPVDPGTPTVPGSDVTNGVISGQVTDHVTGLIGDHLSTAATLRAGYLPEMPKPEKYLWANTWRSMSRVDGLASGSSYQDYQTDAYGIVIGRDTVRENDTLGFAIHIGRSSTKGNGSSSGDNLDSDFYGALVYGRLTRGSWDFYGDLGYTAYKSDYDYLAGSADNVHSSLVSAGVKAVYNLPSKGRLSVGPFFGARFSHYRTDDYTLGDPGKAGTHFDAYEYNQWQFPLGVRFDWKFSEPSAKGWKYKQTLEFSYIRAAGDVEVTRAVKPSGYSSSVNVLSALADENSIAAEAKFEARRKNFTASLNLSGKLSSHQNDWGVGMTFKWQL